MVLDPTYDPVTFIESRVEPVVKLCEVAALGRDSEHPDLGHSSSLGRRIRANYFHVLNAFRSYADRHEMVWDLPDWTTSADVMGTPDARVRAWSVEQWMAEDVDAVRTALGHHLAMLDAASGSLPRRDRKVANRTLFLVGSEARAMYNVTARIYAPTRADRRRWEGGDEVEVS